MYKEIQIIVFNRIKMIDKCCCARIFILAILIIISIFLITSEWLFDIPGVTDNESVTEALQYIGSAILIITFIYIFCFLCN